MDRPITILNKPSLRRMVSQLKAQMTDDEKQRQADAVFAQIEHIHQFLDAEDVAAYWSLNDEIDTQRFIEKWCKRKRIWLPVVVGNDLVFKQYTSIENMRKGAFGILEPTGPQLTDTNKLGVIIVPGVAFDTQNNRMGRGRGFYDRTLQQTCAFKIGIAFSCQIFSQIPTISTDIPMDLVVAG